MPGFKILGSETNAGPTNMQEFNRAHRWRILDIGFPVPAGGGAGSGPAADKLLGAGLFAKSLQLPSLSFEEEKVAGGATTYYKIAKRALWENVTVTFYDTVSLYDIFKKWQDKIWTPEDGIKKASDYKGVATFLLTNNEGDRAQTFKLRNAYPSKIAHGELSYTNSDIKLLTVTYSYDFAEISIP